MPLRISTQSGSRSAAAFGRGASLRHGRHRTRCHFNCCCTLLAATLLAAGCQSSAYRARQLPNEFRAAPLQHANTIDFSRVASPGVSTSIIAPSDLLKITISSGRSDENPAPILARVADNGTVDISVIGPVPVAGMEAYDASRSIASQAIARGMYRHPLVTVEIESKAVNRVTVLGAVENPGVKELPRGSSDLVAALAAAGGLTKEAGTEVEILRQTQFGLAANEVQQDAEGLPASDVQLAAYQAVGAPRSTPDQSRASQAPQTLKLDLANGQPNRHQDYRLNDRDVVRVIPRKKHVIHVSGLVKKPGQFELPLDQDIHLLGAIALAGGCSSTVADKILVIRRVENRPDPLIIQASLAKAKQNGQENLRLAAGDTITVEQTPATVLVDTVSKFFRLTFGVASSTVF